MLSRVDPLEGTGNCSASRHRPGLLHTPSQGVATRFNPALRVCNFYTEGCGLTSALRTRLPALGAKSFCVPEIRAWALGKKRHPLSTSTLTPSTL